MNESNRNKSPIIKRKVKSSREDFKKMVLLGGKKYLEEIEVLNKKDDSFYSKTSFMSGNNKDIYNICRIEIFNKNGEPIESWIVVHTNSEEVSYLELYYQINCIIKNYDGI